MADMTNKSQAKTAMLLELESIKGLLQEEDDIPILQEVDEPLTPVDDSAFEDTDLSITQDEVEPLPLGRHAGQPFKQQELTEKDDKPRGRHFVEQQQDFFHAEISHTHSRAQPTTKPETAMPKTALKKPAGENPFLPEHIRARLHGNNPPPSFEQMTANRIAQTHKPSRLLGATQTHFAAASAKENLINEIVDKLLPEIEIELRERLEKMTDQQLDELHRP